MEVPANITPELLDESYKQHALVSDMIDQIVGQMQELMRSLVSYQSTTHTALLCCDKFKKVLKDHHELRNKLPFDASTWNAEVHEEMILTWNTSVGHCSDMADIVDGMKQCIRKESHSITGVLDKMKALNEALPICNVQATAKPFRDATACHKIYAGSVDLVKDIVMDFAKRQKPKASGNVSQYFQPDGKKKAAGAGIMIALDQSLTASNQNDVQELSDSDEEAEMRFSTSHDKQNQNKEADESHGNHNPSAHKLFERHKSSEKIEEDIADTDDEASPGATTAKNVCAGQASSSSSGSKKRPKPAESPDAENSSLPLLSRMNAMEDSRQPHKKANMQAEGLPIPPSHRKQYGTAEQKLSMAEALSPQHKELPGNNAKAMHQAQQALPAVASLKHLDEQQHVADSGQEMRRKSPRAKSPAASLSMDSNSDNDSSYDEHPQGARKLHQSASKKHVHPASLMKGNPSPPQSSATRDPVAAIKGKSSGQVHQPPQLDMVPKKDKKDRHRGEEVVDLT